MGDESYITPEKGHEEEREDGTGGGVSVGDWRRGETGNTVPRQKG